MMTEPVSANSFLKLQEKHTYTKPTCSAAFFRAIAAGTLVGGGPFSVVSTWVAIEVSAVEWHLRLALAFGPIVLAGVIVLAAMLSIGLFATHILSARRAERLASYLAIGVAGGVLFSIIATALFTVELDWEAIGIFGAAGIFAGLATSFVWGRHRMRLLASNDTLETATRDNPIHDLLH